MKRPNILILHADQLRADCLGVYGNRDVSTPNIDRLAGDGVTYTRHFCPFPVCTPSRYSLITGLFVHQHLGADNHCTLPGGLETFPRILKENGYRTKAVGKMHYTPTYLDVGFEEMELCEQDGPGRYDDDYHRYLMDKGLADRADLTDQVAEYRRDAPAPYWDTFGALESNLDEEDYSTSWIGARALETVNGWDVSGGRLLMVGFVKPHHPFDPPKPWSQMYDPDKISLLPGWLERPPEADMAYSEGYFLHRRLDAGRLRKVMAMYYATISQIDAWVGRIVGALKANGAYDNTMVVFTSDHGDYMGFHHMLLKANRMYDPLVRIPLIVKYPGGGRAAASSILCCTTDVAPTVLDAAGIEPGPRMKGFSLLHGEGHRRIFAQNFGCEEYMVRSKDYKLLLSRKRDQSMFFDLAADPLEMNNLYGDPRYGGLVGDYERDLADWILFGNPAPVHLDERARTVPGGHAGEREKTAAYYRSRMRQE